MNPPAAANPPPPPQSLSRDIAEECQLRLLMLADLDAYKTLRDGMLADHPGAFTSDAQTERQRDTDSYRNRLSGASGGSNLFTLVAWSGTRMVGAVSCEHDMRVKVRHIAHVVGMMVADDLQGCGIGQRLLVQALRLLQGEPSLDLVTLSVSANNASAVHLYERCGFTRYGRLLGALKMPDGELLDKDLMSRRLR